MLLIDALRSVIEQVKNKCASAGAEYMMIKTIWNLGWCTERGSEMDFLPDIELKQIYLITSLDLPSLNNFVQTAYNFNGKFYWLSALYVSTKKVYR